MHPIFKHLYVLFILNLIKDSTAEISNINSISKVSNNGKSYYEKNREILEWEAPIEMKEAYPYYFSGHDEHGNPVWVNQFGRWDVRWLYEGGSKFEPLWEKYAQQYLHRIYFSAKNATAQIGESGEENPIEGFIIISDLDGYSHRQYLHSSALKRTLKFFQMLFNMELVETAPSLKICYFINTNFAARSLWTGIRSLLGEFASKFEPFGTNSNTWKHEILKEIPRESLPHKYGGAKNWKPIEY